MEKPIKEPIAEPTTGNPTLHKYLNVRYLKRGILLFAFISLLSFTLLYIYTNTGSVVETLRAVQLKYVAIAVLLMFFDWWIGGFRNHIFVRLLIEKVSWRVCFDANLANIFVGAVTPSQTGGGPAQFYIWYRNGVKISDCVAISIINYISTILFMLGGSLAAIYYLKNAIDNALLFTLIKSSFIIFSTFFSLILLSLLLPKQMSKVIIGLFTLLAKLLPSKKDLFEGIAQKLSEAIQHYHTTMLLFTKGKPYLFPASFIITFIMYTNKYVIAYMLLRGLGLDAPLLTVLAIQAVLFFILYFAPSPGGSGIAELSIAVLMATIIPDAQLATFTVAHRAFLLFIPAVVGAFIMLGALKKQEAEVAGQSS